MASENPESTSDATQSNLEVTQRPGNPELMGLSTADYEWIESLLERCDFVDWGWHQLSDLPNTDGEKRIDVYGWVTEEDGQRHIIHISFETHGRSYTVTTSHEKHAVRLHEQLEPPNADAPTLCSSPDSTFNL
jgi:hypothetical protein